jgi:hypothetical protein
MKEFEGKVALVTGGGSDQQIHEEESQELTRVHQRYGVAGA